MKEMSPSQQLLLGAFVTLALGLILVANGVLSFFLNALQPFGLNPLSDIIAGVFLLALSFWVYNRSLAALALALGIFWTQFVTAVLAQWRAGSLGMPFLFNTVFVASITLLLWPGFKAMQMLKSQK